jgi:hypothetical protein
MIECNEGEFCPTIELTFLPLSTDDLKEILQCINEVYSIGLSLVISIFPEIMNFEDSVLLEYFNQDDIDTIRDYLIESGVEVHVISETIDYEECLKKRKQLNS